MARPDVATLIARLDGGKVYCLSGGLGRSCKWGSVDFCFPEREELGLLLRYYAATIRGCLYQVFLNSGLAHCHDRSAITDSSTDGLTLLGTKTAHLC